MDHKLSHMDAHLTVRDDGSIKVKIYRKPTHTDQYLHFSSNHHVSQKLSVPKTLLRRADVMISEEEDRIEEEAHVSTTLRRCGYPD